jgi:hypothetical protein
VGDPQNPGSARGDSTGKGIPPTGVSPGPINHEPWDNSSRTGLGSKGGAKCDSTGTGSAAGGGTDPSGGREIISGFKGNSMTKTRAN